MNASLVRRTVPRASLGLVAIVVAVTAGVAHSEQSPASPPSTAAPATSPAAASSETSTAASPATSAAADASAPSPATAAPDMVGGARAVLAAMTLPQRVGQVFMVGTPATLLSRDVVHAVKVDHVGNVMLTGRSSAGVAATAKVSARLQKLVTTASTDRVPLFVGTDQEGGLVQVLRGPGFSTMPTALVQGTWSAASVKAYAKKWGGQLRAAGVDVDLAPVLDTVPSPAAARTNPPIGHYKREYGFTPAIVSSRGGAFAAGLGLAGVDASIKHFPGLGRVTANTDVTAGVTDRVTTRHDPYLQPYAAAIKAGAPFVMMSTAIYAKIDPARPAAFSKTVINTVLRGDLKFPGVVISDDLGNAKQVARWTPGARAVDFVRAGGDMVLTVNGALLQPMYAAVLAKATTDPVFRARLNNAALHVLLAKQDLGLIAPPHAIGKPPTGPTTAATPGPSDGQQDLPDVAARLEQPMSLGRL